jgi:imidazolonepropionase-like amidohydrolase
VGAEIVGLPGEIGEITEGAHADLLVVEGNPLDDISILTDPDRNLRLVMREGHVVKDELGLGANPCCSPDPHE